MNRGAPWFLRGETTSTAGIRLLFSIYRVFGRRLFLAALLPVIVFYWAANPSARAASADYLSRLFAAGAYPHRPRMFDTLRHFLFFGEAILDKIAAISPSCRGPELDAEGAEALNSLLEEGKGAVVLMSHTGCTEVIERFGCERIQGPLIVLRYTGHSQRFNALMREINPLSALRFMDVDTLSPADACELDDAVRKGGFIFVAADRVPMHSDATADVKFFGEKAKFPIGGILIANMLHCALVQLTCVRAPRAGRKACEPNRYIARAELLSDEVRLSRRCRAAQAADFAARYAAGLEKVLRQSPYDWFNFFPFWENSEENRK